MIKAILFDLDGTLLDTNELIYNSFCHTFNEFINREVSKSEITNLYGKPLEYSFSSYTEDKELVDKMIKVYREYNLKHHDNMCVPFDGVVELLTKLKNKGIKLGIVTSKKKDTAIRGMKVGKILDFMDVIITPEVTKKHKPHGEPALKACEILNVSPSETIMVGDSSYDLLCGKRAGCYTCGVHYTAINIEELLAV